MDSVNSNPSEDLNMDSHPVIPITDGTVKENSAASPETEGDNIDDDLLINDDTYLEILTLSSMPTTGSI